jgi:hypothetical protein
MPKSAIPFISFGTDEAGEMYVLCESLDGRGIQGIVKAAGGG